MRSSVMAVVVAIFLSLSSNATSQAREYVPRGADLKAEDTIAFMIKDTSDGPSFVSLIRQETPPELLSNNGNRWCLDFSSENCSLSKSGVIQAYALLPVCTDQESNCIEAVQIFDKDAEPTPAGFVKQFEGFQFPEVQPLGTPRGATPSLWSGQKEHAENGVNYVVTVGLGFDIHDGQRVQYRSITATVHPVVELTGASYKPAEIQSRFIDGVKWWNHDNGEQGSLDGCVATEIGKCWAKSEFSAGTRVELSLRVTNQISGWLHGRLKAPSVEIAAIDEKINRMVISAEPVDVPILYGEVKYSTLDSQTKDLLVSRHSSGGFNGGKEWQIHPSDSLGSRKIIQQFSKTLGDKAAAVSSVWQFKSVDNGRFPNKCLDIKSGSNRFAGLVTTNAMSYEGTAPNFDKGFLNYVVSGLHYSPDGSETVGTYDLVMRSDLARCLYNFNKAPISATVTVTGGSNQNVATTVVSEKSGWLKLAAYGFNFSQKTIKVKLTQKKSTITCMNTKNSLLTKKITSYGPTCPSGYKKK